MKSLFLFLIVAIIVTFVTFAVSFSLSFTSVYFYIQAKRHPVSKYSFDPKDRSYDLYQYDDSEIRKNLPDEHDTALETWKTGKGDSID